MQYTLTRPGQLVNRAARLMARWGDPRFRRHGLAIAQLPVLAALSDGASLSQSDLVGLSHIEQPTMAQLLARMERDGLVRRSADREDGRRVRFSLTAAARQRLPRAQAVLDEGQAAAFDGFSDAEIVTLCELLGRVIDNLLPAASESPAS